MGTSLYATLSTREWGFITCKKKTKRSDPAIDPRAAYSALRAMFNISWVEKQALRCLVPVRRFPRPSRSACDLISFNSGQIAIIFELFSTILLVADVCFN